MEFYQPSLLSYFSCLLWDPSQSSSETSWNCFLNGTFGVLWWTWMSLIWISPFCSTTCWGLPVANLQDHAFMEKSATKHLGFDVPKWHMPFMIFHVPRQPWHVEWCNWSRAAAFQENLTSRHWRETAGGLASTRILILISDTGTADAYLGGQVWDRVMPRSHHNPVTF